MTMSILDDINLQYIVGNRGVFDCFWSKNHYGGNEFIGQYKKIKVHK